MTEISYYFERERIQLLSLMTGFSYTDTNSDWSRSMCNDLKHFEFYFYFNGLCKNITALNRISIVEVNALVLFLQNIGIVVYALNSHNTRNKGLLTDQQKPEVFNSVKYIRIIFTITVHSLIKVNSNTGRVKNVKRFPIFFYFISTDVVFTVLL